MSLPAWDPITGLPYWDSTGSDLPATSCCGSSPSPCSECNAGTTHSQYRLDFQAGVYTNGTCANCTAIPGASITVTQMAPCVWEGSFTPGGGCTFNVQMQITGSDVIVTLIKNDNLGTAYTWDLPITPPVDCSSFTIPADFGFLSGIPFCNPGATDTGGSIIATGL